MELGLVVLASRHEDNALISPHTSDLRKIRPVRSVPSK
jgi:hypothetical protein